MKQEFNKLIEELKTDSKLLISVINASTYNKIIPAKSGEDLVLEYGSIENFFEDSFKNGNQKILVTKYNKRGTGLTKIANAVLFDFSSKEENTAQPMAVVPQPQAVLPPSLNGAHQSVGLGVPELINYAVNASRSQVLEIENGYLKANNEDLKKQLDTLKEERMADKYSADNKKNQNEMILGLSQAFLPMLGGLLNKGASAVPLNAPENPFTGLSEKKQQMLDFIAQDTTLDAHIDFLFSIIEKTNVDPNFYTEIQELINKPNE